MNAPKPPAKTIAEWLAQPEDARLELIGGVLLEKPPASMEHAIAQASTIARVRPQFHRLQGGPNGPGGWWIGSEVDVVMDGSGYRPDIAGWRRDRVPDALKQRPVAIRPDWICEILGESNRSTAKVKKLRGYYQSGVSHYWLLDSVSRTLMVHRHSVDGYIVVVAAPAEETVRAEPFEAIELKVGELLGDDPE